MLDARSPAPLSLAAVRRRESMREEHKEHKEHRRIAKLMDYYIDKTNSFWSSIENKPRSMISGRIQKEYGVRAGMPDIIAFQRRNGRTRTVFLELKSRRGVVSVNQKQIRLELERIGAHWWLIRSARSGLVALYRSGIIFRRPFTPPRLPRWEEPVRDPKKTIWAPSVLAQWQSEKREQRARYQARIATDHAAGAAAPPA
jgi:hypothetical protein